jgi:branched-chain amino acid transport system substrate-binding protein
MAVVLVQGVTASPSSSSQAKGTPIKVGFICSCSGLGAFGGYDALAEDVYLAWADAVNASGGINGHRVQVITEDDASNPSTADSVAQTLIADHVVAIADMSLNDAAFAPVVEAAKIPVVGVFTAGATFDTNPDFYPQGTTDNSIFPAIVATTKTAGATNISNFYCAEESTCAMGAPLVTAAGKQAGVPDVYNEAISFAAPNYTAPCVAADQKHVAALFIADIPAVIMKVASDCAVQDFKPIYVIDGETFSMDLAAAPTLKQNLWAMFTDLPFYANTPAVRAFDAAMDRYYPGKRENASVLDEDAFMAWISGKLLQDAIKAGSLTVHDTPSASEVKKGLTSLKGDTVGGLTPPLTFAAGKTHHIDCWFEGRVQNGVPRVENHSRVYCAK